MSIYSEHAQNVNRIQRDIAAAEAERIARKGALVGGTLSMLGRLPLEILNARDQRQADEQRVSLQAAKEAFAQRKGEAELADLQGRGEDRDAARAQKDEQAKKETAVALLGVANKNNWSAIRTSIGASLPHLKDLLPDDIPAPGELLNLQRGIKGEPMQPVEAPKPTPLITGVDPVTGKPTRTEDKPGVTPYIEPKGQSTPANPTVPSLAYAAAKGDKDAQRALEFINQQRQSDGQEPLQAIMGDDGNPVLVPRSQAVGKRPANTREQGRNVTSGDVSKITDLDASLNDLGVLEKTIAGVSNATGTTAQIQAALPNWATNLSGWGVDAKKKQAVIDRVKQVIGKALEGGVLRKEDEVKYEKILPTIGDPPAVVTSKLAGLKQAIDARREQFLSNLEDANYDVSRYRSHGMRGPLTIGGYTVEVVP